MSNTATATAPDGIVHELAAPGLTDCGQNAGGWSTAVTDVQRLGLVIFCADCAAGSNPCSVPELDQEA